jgi:hypothetical protein
MSENAKPKFTPDSFDNHDYALLMSAARVTLRLAVNDRNSEVDDPNNFFELFTRIETLMAAYVNSEDGKYHADRPSGMLVSFANAVAMTIASVPSLRAAVAAHFGTIQDDDP